MHTKTPELHHLLLQEDAHPILGARSLCIELCNDIISIKLINFNTLLSTISANHCISPTSTFLKDNLVPGMIPALTEPSFSNHFLRFGLISSVSRPLSTENSNDSPMDLIPEGLAARRSQRLSFRFSRGHKLHVQYIFYLVVEPTHLENMNQNGNLPLK